MIKRLFTALTLLLFCGSALFAQNTLTVPSVTIAKGKSMSLPVRMNNTADIVAVQFTLTLPDGITLDTENCVLAERAAGHSLTVRSIGEKRYMAVIFSSTNAAIDGSAGKLLSLNLTASQTVEEGVELPMLLSDVIMSGPDGANLVTEYTAGNIKVALSPDFEVSALRVEAKEANPGDNVLLKWQVANVGGLDTEAGWSETIYLNSSDGTQKHLTTIYSDETLESGAVLTRSAEIKLPELLGIDGEATFSIQLSANKNSGEQAGADGNNSAIAASTILIGKRLGLTPALIETNEASGEKVRYYLTRSGNTSTAETFVVTATQDSRVAVPSSVTVGKGESGAYFYAEITPNKTLDNNSTVNIEVDGNGYPATSAQLVIADDTKPKMSVDASIAEITEGEVLDFTIGIERPLQYDLTIELTADKKSRFKFPTSIVIPAGKTTVSVQIQSVDDSTPDIEQEVTFTVYAAEHQPASTAVILKDNDVPTLHIELTPDKVSESDGPLSVVARIKRSSNIDKSVRIKLSDNSEGNIYYGRNDFEMAAGVEEVTLNLGPIDNALNDGERTYFINAAVYIASCNCSAGEGTTDGITSAQLTVFDNDGPALSLKTDKSVLAEGGKIEVTVTRNTSTENPLTVSLSCDKTSGIEFPSSVTIPAGETSATFNVVSLNNDDTNDGYNATITASATGYANGITWFTVTDQTLPDAQITSIEASVTEAVVGETVTISAVVSNTGNYKLPKNTPIAFYLNSSSSAAGTAYLPHDLAVGESVTVNANVTLPSYIGTYNVYSVVNEDKTVKELSYANNSSKLISIKAVSPFTISVNADKAIYNKEESVLITGVVEGKDVAGKEIEIYVINSNDRHTIKTVTGEDGRFSANYTPHNFQVGYFVLGACYPGENLRTEMSSFSFYGIRQTSNAAIECEALLGDVYSGSVTYSNPGILDLSGIKATVISKPDICEVTVDCPTSVKAGDEFILSYDITPNAASTINDWELIVIKIETEEGASFTTTLYYHCRVKTGMLEASVSSINTTMTKGMSREYVFDITNVGKGETGTISLTLPIQQSWMSSVTPKEMPSLESGETTSVVLRLTPDDSMQLNSPVWGTIALNCSNGKGLQIPYYIEPVSEETGTLTIDVCDENTYYTAEAPHLAGANVTVMHPKTSKVLASGVTNDKGIYSVELPEGYYTIKVTADQHSSYSNNILVDPGKETYKVVNLSYEAITIDWKVEETEVKDEYSVVTTVKYETNVPVPVVELIVPKEINADELQPGESMIFNAVLTNKGLINALDVQLKLPEGFTGLQFEVLDHAVPFTLAPQQSIVIPVRVVKLAAASEDPCVAQFKTLYYWNCGADKKWHLYSVVMQVGSCKSNDTQTWSPSNSGGGGYYGGGYSGPGGISGGGGGYYSSSSSQTPITIHKDVDCYPSGSGESGGTGGTDGTGGSQSSVCSSITLQISQSMVMTRQAFLGTLTVTNGNEDTAMRDVKMALSITDQEGNVATSHEFQINPETLDGFNGSLSLDAGWTLNAKSTGVATIMFIPTRYAAPENNKVYNIGGTLSYIDPFTGLEVTRTLTPVAITVKPSPVLNLTYFMQRDIKGDDPLTEEIEPCEEAEFSLLIHNIGYGDATNVRMVTNQPEIIENEKGLFIDFELMSSQLNGKEKTLALGGSVATDFGTIPSKGTSYAQWWIKSSLLGHFTDYDVQATHITSYDNPDLTLLNDVTIHELIRSIEIVDGNKTIVGFMTNDIADAKDTPDMLYLSNGEKETVGKADATITKISDTEYRLTVTPSSTGWVYGNISDPTYGVSAINSIVRQSDNKEISLRNIWQTDRTLRDGKEPLYENMLHFADEFESLTPETYILTFNPTPKTQLEVIAIEGLPSEGEIAKKHVESINVVFNKQIDPQTFTSEDLSLAVQGVSQDASLMKITTEDDKTFKLDLSAYNGITGNGYYVLQVQTAEITDKEGFNGKTGKSAGWIMYRDGYTSLTTSVYPEQAGYISLAAKEGTEAGTQGNKTVNLAYGETYILTATANEGYNFLNWSIDGVVVSEQPQIEHIALSDVKIVANFAFNTYAVEVESTTDGGSIIGTSTGVYNYGTELSFTAIPDKDYAFEHWYVNGEEAGNQTTLTITVDKPYTVSAVFKKEYYNQKITFAKGWNWISSYLSEPISVAELANNSVRIIGQYDEIAKDQDNGFTGNFNKLDNNSSYKVLASSAFIINPRGHLNDNPLSLKSGWNWIAYPYYESKSLSATVANAENGDLLISQKGFAEYADGNWEGTLTELVPGCGYIYKSVSDKTLQLQLDSQATAEEKPAVTPSIDLGRVSYEHPNTMNIIARLYQGDQLADNGTYEVYAMVGDSYRGYGQKIGENYYITVYGEESVEISFIILNSSTGTTYKAKNTMSFTDDVIGSRVSPYGMTFEDTPTCIGTIFNQNDKFKVYSIEGILISNNASIDELHKLPKGIYIVNGSKYIVK